jgi:hypothetical protein
MPNCGRISDDILNDCAFPLVGGVKDRLILINADDIDEYTVSVSNPQIIEDIALVTSPAARGYEFEGLNSSNDKETSLNFGRYTRTYNHQVTFRVFQNGPDVKAQLEALAKGKVVAIVEHNFRGSDGSAAFELLGRVQGLEVLEMTSNMSDQETQGAYVVRLSTPELFKEPNLPATVFITDYATTKTMVDGLLV